MEKYFPPFKVQYHEIFLLQNFVVVQPHLMCCPKDWRNISEQNDIMTNIMEEIWYKREKKIPKESNKITNQETVNWLDYKPNWTYKDHLELLANPSCLPEPLCLPDQRAPCVMYLSLPTSVPFLSPPPLLIWFHTRTEKYPWIRVKTELLYPASISILSSQTSQFRNN